MSIVPSSHSSQSHPVSDTGYSTVGTSLPKCVSMSRHGAGPGRTRHVLVSDTGYEGAETSSWMCDA
jgi:hypothetical protein